MPQFLASQQNILESQSIDSSSSLRDLKFFNERYQNSLARATSSQALRVRPIALLVLLGTDSESSLLKVPEHRYMIH